uniref:Uncharacterized protein n=1 Tax=Panagrolaimus sp. JU765 TaxID=591449 RepID=A0AC34PZ62_9BILA
MKERFAIPDGIRIQVKMRVFDVNGYYRRENQHMKSRVIDGCTYDLCCTRPIDSGNFSIPSDFRHSTSLRATSLQPFHKTALLEANTSVKNVDENMENAMKTTGSARIQAIKKRIRLIDSDDDLRHGSDDEMQQSSVVSPVLAAL